MELSGRHFRTGSPITLTIADGIIQECQPCSSTGIETVWLAPSIFDVQINGALGHAFNDPELTLEGIAAIVAVAHQHGIGRLLPTLVTAAPATLEQSLHTLQAACQRNTELSFRLPGVHLEGPFLSQETGPRGAHPQAHLCHPNWDMFQRFQNAAEGQIRLVTLAPELPGALDFIERLTASGVIAAIGHTAATPACIRDAVTAGARLSTHLGNGCHAYLPRHDNYLWEQLACDELWASLIVDGFHLPPAVVRSLVRGKTLNRVILTCDASPVAGCAPGKYSLWGQTVELTAEGRVGVVDSPFLAGSGVFTDTCLANLVAADWMSFPEAIATATLHPRRLLDLPEPTLAAGEPAEVMAVQVSSEKKLEILATT